MLKCNSSTFGSLVRPRVLLKTLTATTDSPLSVAYTREQQAQAVEHFTLGGVVELFKSLSLGDTCKDLASCYTGKVASFIVMFPRTQEYHKVDKRKLLRLERLAKNRNGRDWVVCAVGLEFYQSLKIDKEGYLEAVNPWPHSKGQDREWYYFPEDLVLMDNIVVYERCEPGDFITTPKASGLVVQVKELNKPQFYRTSSWTCKSVVLLSGQHCKRVRLLPSRKIEITRHNLDGRVWNPLVE